MSHVNLEGYRLMRSAFSSSRLNLQHYLWKETCGFNIHPRIPISGDSKLRIADIGTGTGIWITDVKRQHPDLQIDGFDISLAQCPPSELCPEGCSFQQLDVVSEIPQKLKGAYDIVHVRLWLGSIRDDPVPTLRSLMAMLKPGGYLQWQELNLSSITVVAVKENLDGQAPQDLLNEVQNFGIGRWAPHLAKTCAENGMLESATDKYHVPPEITVPFCQTQLDAFTEISLNKMANDSDDSPGPQLRRLIEKAHGALNKGVVFDYWLEVTVAKKPV